MRACIHHGSSAIGGSCVELEHDGTRLVLDLGAPLDTDVGEIAHPHLQALFADGNRPAALLVTHGHPDHYGLVPLLPAPVPLYIGADAYHLLDQARFFTGAPALPVPAGVLVDGESLHFGPFTVTPYLADHSAYDAYSLLVDAGNRRLFYSGDLRAHGRRRAFERLVARPPASIDALLIEGTKVGQASTGSSATEAELELALAKEMRATDGAVLACYSGQNIDRLVTMYRAAVRSRRTLVIDLYTALLARATGRATIPQAEWENVRVFLPSSQRARVMRQRAFDLTDSVRASRIYPEELAERAAELVITFRASMATDVERAKCLSGARVIWSMWSGYLERESGAGIRQFADRHGLPIEVLHSSGHADVADLERLARALNANRVVPIHTEAPERFAEHFANVERYDDGEWWSV